MANERITPEQFCYWLQGKFEDRDSPLSKKEIASVKAHLQKVFLKVTPSNPLKDLEDILKPEVMPGPFVPVRPLTPYDPWRVDKDDSRWPGNPFGPTIVCSAEVPFTKACSIQ